MKTLKEEILQYFKNCEDNDIMKHPEDLTHDILIIVKKYMTNMFIKVCKND